MTEPAVPFLRPYTPQELHAALRDRLGVLRAELDAEMAARVRAEAEADDLRRRVEGLEAENGTLWWLVGERLLQGAWSFALAGLVAGFGGVFLIRWAAW